MGQYAEILKATDSGRKPIYIGGSLLDQADEAFWPAATLYDQLTEATSLRH